MDPRGGFLERRAAFLATDSKQRPGVRHEPGLLYCSFFSASVLDSRGAIAFCGRGLGPRAFFLRERGVEEKPPSIRIASAFSLYLAFDLPHVLFALIAAEIQKPFPGHLTRKDSIQARYYHHRRQP